MLASYVLADLRRNPRRTLSTLIGVSLGVGLFCGVLFFIDGLSASMTQRALEPLPLDMQRIVSQRGANSLTLTQQVGPPSRLGSGDRTRVDLTVRNPGTLRASEVTVRSVPGPGLTFVLGSAQLDGRPITGFDDNPLASDPGQTGYNLGVLLPGAVQRISYLVEAQTATQVDEFSVASTYSSRESVAPIAANQPPPLAPADLAARIADLPGVAHASELSIADLGSDVLSTSSSTASGPAKIFGFDDTYARYDDTISITQGTLSNHGAVISAEAADALRARIGDTVTVSLPDDSSLDLEVTGVADLTRSRSLFSSRRGGDLETFVYTRHSVIVSPAMFAEMVFPAYERAIARGGGRLKSPPIREVDIAVDRSLLDADPATAVNETRGIAASVMEVAKEQDYLLDNVSNTLAVAAGDASTAKRLFIFMGVPGALLAAVLAAYAGNVLAEAQRREHATLRIRGASRRQLLRMLALRTILLTATGATIGLATGYLAAGEILGRDSLARASPASLVISGLLGTLGGFLATGFALYLTGRRSIDREINEDRAHIQGRAPLWWRMRLDILVATVLVVGTLGALREHAFAGRAGSVYFGRSVHLNLSLLVLPITAWATGGLLAARVTGSILTHSRPAPTAHLAHPAPSLLRRSVTRRPWAISTGVMVVSLIVGLAVSLTAFTASYNAAKSADARFANGADIKITPSPTAERTYSADDADAFRTVTVTATTPVIYGLSNVILRSARTSDPANLAAVDPDQFPHVAPVEAGASEAMSSLVRDPNAVLVSEDMAAFLQAKVGDPLFVLLARATDDQVETTMKITGLYERMPGFPDGVDAIMNVSRHTELVPTKAPDFFLASTRDDAALARAVTELQTGPAAADHLQIDTRSSTLDRDQSSLAALNISGLIDLDSGFALVMATVAIALFVFGLLMQRRREYVTLRAQGLGFSTIRVLVLAEAALVAVAGTVCGILIGAGMGYYLVTVLRPLFVLHPAYHLPVADLAPIVLLLVGATVLSSVVGSLLINSLQPAELLRDE